jgi:hypothetical protein
MNAILFGSVIKTSHSPVFTSDNQREVLTVLLVKFLESFVISELLIYLDDFDLSLPKCLNHLDRGVEEYGSFLSLFLQKINENV